MTERNITEDIRQDLQRLADQVRLKAHLASMDARDAWAKLEPKLSEYERTLESTTDKLADGVRKLGNDLLAELRELHAKLPSADRS